ncbi:MAG: glycoside hydrolase family 9 protein [Fibrobacter sp.]|nr:glycoside hydrolase family 9 protein [Fibrobacter sp.]
MIKTIFLLGLSLVATISAATIYDLPNIDRTCHDCDRRYLDSINVYARRNIRVNQVGFRPQDQKYAYVADIPAGTAFSVIDVSTGKEAYSGTTEALMENVTKPNVWVNGVFKSIGTKLYMFGDSTASTKTENLTKATFSSLTSQGEYYVKIGADTSAHFNIDPGVFNAIFETALKFLGAQRCGNTNSWFHAACHLQDGSEVGHDLTGGWHDCGDHFKVSETMTYTAYGLITTYLVHPDRAEDRFGNSYNDTVFTDGIPDILYEAKIGADFFFKLYKASKADGLIEKHDMYHSVGIGSEDHQFWDKPEKQDAQPFSKGGPDRHVAKGVGTSSGMIAAVLAYFSVGWEPYDPVYADSLRNAAIDIYANVVKYNTKSISKGTQYVRTDELKGFYPGGSSEANWMDDAAAGALALWYATKDTIYQYDLYKNEDINENSTNYMYNNEPDDAGPYFKGGILGHLSGFSPGGWMLDFENVHSLVLYSFARLILEDKETAAKYNVGELERDTLFQRTVNLLRRLTDDGTQGDLLVHKNRFGNVTAVRPYNLVWTSSDWGFNRYNMGAINQFFMLSELTQGEEKQAYLNIALDNIYYNLGANPWDVSFIMGVGDKNLNHPHNRASNPDGYNAGGVPYQYRCPLGALMGGASPEKTLKDDWEDYTVTETCADFTTTLFMPMLIFSNSLPVDKEGPIFSNIAGTPISDTEAIISWDANEVALVTVFYNTTPDVAGAKSVQQGTASKGGSLTIDGLVTGETYYFFLEGMDTKRNLSTDDNHGMWYKFTMNPASTTISGVTICQVDHRSAKIYWWSDKRMNGIVNYGTSTSNLNEAQAAEGGAVLFHEATLTNLKAGTTYYFSVSSGSTTDENGGKYYTFQTESEASYADIDIFVKPSSYQSDAECSNWEDCHQLMFYLVNNDTMPFHDFEVRVYLGDNPNFATVPWSNSIMNQNWGGDGLMTNIKSYSFGSPTLEGDQYYLPINIKDTLQVSGQMVVTALFEKGKGSFKDFKNSWSMAPHMAATDPEKFNGIPLEKGPVYRGSETEQLEDPDKDGIGDIAITRDPYITVYYHGKHIYGYGPTYTPENGPLTIKTVDLNFTSPFVTPHYSVEKVDSATTYAGSSKVSPTGILDEFEMNGMSMFAVTNYVPSNRKDSLEFKYSTISSYGNNYTEWVSWHNRAANLNGSYDCACAVVRSNVEIDSITIPPEQRYLEFLTDTILTYTGKIAEVRVRLLDSNKVPLAEDISILVSSATGFATFYTSSEATHPVERIDLIKGEAVFYLKSDTPTETILKAMGNTTATVAYTPATAVLIIKEIPPWPIIDDAKMIDSDCDNIPDAIHITLTNEYQPGQSFTSVSFEYEGKVYETTKVNSLEGRDLVVGINIPGATINTSPYGKITLNSTTESGIQSHDYFYKDGMAPILLSISVLELLDTATTDRVYMQFSEPVAVPSAEWPLSLFASDKTTPGATPTVISSQIYNDSLNIWEFEIAFAADGSSIVTEGMFARLLSSAGIKDKNGNGISSCEPPLLPITLKLIPVPMIYAAISDANEDGLAEHVDIEFEREVDERHVPNNVSVIFGRTEPETLWVAGTDLSFSASRTEATLDFMQPFKLGNTSGTYSGSSRGMAIENAGLVVQHLGEGASYESSDVLGEDKAGPVFVVASINNTSGDMGILKVEISEPVNVVDSSRIYYRQKMDNVDTIIYMHDVYKMSFMAGKSTLAVTFDATSDLAPSEGGFVRMQPKEFSALVDQSGNMPAINNPWIPIGSSGDVKVKFKVKLVNEDKVGTSGGPNRSQVASSENVRLYIQNPNTKKLDLVIGGQVVAQGIDSTMMNGTIWRIELNVPRGGASSEDAAWESLKFKYNIPIYSNLGSYVNRSAGSFIVTPQQYLSSASKVVFFVEWANMDGTGLQAENGRAIATGAYVYKAQLEAKFTPNLNKDIETAKRFSSATSYDKTEVFGVRRIK